ncbi:MAG: type II toxin-antitoxin system RelE/ParE family toxin [Gallionellaceae bacterium]|nr:type II toxin-antitoxin system RelE/ParE family toxin [Gallionellaceae bacterium]
MMRLVFSPRALQDMERLTDFLLEADEPQAARETIPILLRGLAILAEHPLIGHKVEAGLRELVISRGRTGYLALYDYDPKRDTVIVQAIRHQREGGYGE